MRVAVLKLAGVESVEVSLEKASADIRFKPDNRIALQELREVIRRNGYPTKDAQFTARGKMVDRNGKPALDLLNGSTIDLVSDPKNASAFAQVEALRREGRQAIIELKGVSRAAGKNVEQASVIEILGGT